MLTVPDKGFTHAGRFHADDVFAAALLGLLIGELTFRYGGKLLDKISRRQKQ